MTTAIYPGSFDPIHNGHLDVIRRAADLFPRVIVAVSRETQKNGLLTAGVRLKVIQASVAGLPRVEVQGFTGLTVAFARAVGAEVIVKGLRGVEDFEHELRQAVVNRQLSGLDTVFFMPSPPWAQISSTLIREVARLGGDVSSFVPPAVAAHLRGPRRR